MILPQNPPFKEEWGILPIDVFPNIKRIYLVSSYGVLHNLQTGNYLPSKIDISKNHYININLSTIDNGHCHMDLHRIVLITFYYIPFCESLQVNHKDGIKFHNWLWNLEWVDNRGNTLHAIKNNLITLGQDRENSVLSNAIVHEICSLMARGMPTKSIQNIIQDKIPINCDLRRIICNIKAGLSWKHISCNYDFSNASSVKRTLTQDQIHFICNYYQNNGMESITVPNLLYLLSIDFYKLSDKEKTSYYNTISGIKNKRLFKEICTMYNY